MVYLEISVSFLAVACETGYTNSRETTSPIAERCLVGFFGAAFGVV